MFINISDTKQIFLGRYKITIFYIEVEIMGNAFVYMFEDKNFGIKFFCVFALVSIALLVGNLQNNNSTLISIIISSLGGIITLGYFIECIKSVKTSFNKIHLPFIGINSVLVGIKASIGALLINAIAAFVSVFTLYIPTMIVALVSPALLSVFSDEYKIKSYFAFNKAAYIIREDFGKYFSTLLALIFYTTFVTTAMYLLLNKLGIKPEDLITGGQITLNIIAVSIFFAFVYTYNLYVFAFWIGDLYKMNRYDTEDEYFQR